MPQPIPCPPEKACGAALRGERKGRTCPNWPTTGKTRCRMHGGGRRSGAQKGNKNTLKHGLFSKGLGPEGKEAYEAIGAAEPQELAADTASFLLAKTLEASATLSEEIGPLARMLRAMRDKDTATAAEIAAKGLSDASYERALRRLNGLSPVDAARAISPVKGLLELKVDKTNDDGQSLDAALDQLDAAE